MLSKLFNNRSETVKHLKTTTVPDGVIRHIGERPWDNYDWDTYNHPRFLEMKRNKYGSYDIVQHTKASFLRWLKNTPKTHLSQRQALNVLINQQVDVMRKYGGYNANFTSGDLRDHIQNGSFPHNHIFTYVKKHPEAVDHYLADFYPQQKQSAPKPEAKPAEPALKLTPQAKIGR